MIRRSCRLFVLCFGLMCVFAFAAAAGGEQTLALRTVEDTGVTVEDSVCAAGGFVPHIRLGAHVWSLQTRASDGGVVNDMVRQVGTAKACVRITDFGFTPFSVHPFYIRFDLEGRTLTGSGYCTITSNNVPVLGLVLAGCNLQLTDLASGDAVGSAESSSVFNPFRLTDFSTGSYWTLRLYEN